MGSQVRAKCKCGLKAKILIGGSMRNFLEIEYFPFFCGECSSVVQANLKEALPSCVSCKSNRIIPYTNSKLIQKAGKDTIAQSFDNVITNGLYKCPKCLEFSLQFTHGDTLWD